MGIITLENMDRLYWLGRYSERVYTTSKLFADSFDNMIDQDFTYFAEFCQKLDIPNIYSSKEDFNNRYCFDSTDPNSIYANLIRAYDNAIVLREEIGSEPLSYIQLAMYKMNMSEQTNAPLITLQKVTDNILAFWGIADDLIEDENVRNTVKVGKRIERIDLYGRLHAPQAAILREIHRLKGRISKTFLKYDKEKLENMIAEAENDEIDYYKIVQDVDNLLIW